MLQPAGREQPISILLSSFTLLNRVVISELFVGKGLCKLPDSSQELCTVCRVLPGPSPNHASVPSDTLSVQKIQSQCLEMFLSAIY